MSADHAPDPHRTLALLWQDRERIRPGPKPGLDLHRIVGCAIELADRAGVGALTMRAVAAELDVGTASLYTYVPGRHELIALMLDSVAGHSSLPHTFPGGWRARLEAWAREDWAEFHRHPWVLHVVSASVLPGPNMLAWYDSALSVLDDTGLSELEKVAAIETVDAYLRGQAWNSVEGSQPPANAAGGEPWDGRRASAMIELVDFDRFPALRRALSAGVHPLVSDTFELGLQRVLDGIESLVEERSTDG